jgi:hypothetical protein
VLECGHFVCEHCLKKTDKCLIYTCLNPINHSKNRSFIFNKKKLLGNSLVKKVRYFNIVLKVSQETHAETVE